MGHAETSLKTQQKLRYNLIEFEGNLEYGKIESMKKDLQENIFKTDTDYVISMQKVKNIDSTGFGMIVNFAKKVAVKGRKISIIVNDDFIRDLFAISQCDRVFPIVSSETEAEKVMQEGWESELSINEY